MRPVGVFLGAVVLAASTAARDHLTEEIVIGQENSYKNGDDRPGYQLVAFIHPGDEASQALETEWARLKELAGENLNIPTTRAGRIVSIDCTASPFFEKLCQEERIRSYPTIRLYREWIHGDYKRYRGPHKGKDILFFLQRSLGPTLSMVDEKNITEFVNKDFIVFLGNFVGNDDTQAEKWFRAAAVKYRDRFSFGLKKEGAAGNDDTDEKSKVKCWNHLDSEEHETTRLDTPDVLEAFIKLCSTPLIPEMTRRNELSFYESRKSIVHYFTRNEQERRDFHLEMLGLAKKYREYLHFTTTDVNEYPDAPEMMGLEWGSSKGLSVQNPNNGDIYPYTGGKPISGVVVESFLNDIIQGKVKPWAKDGNVEMEHDEL